MDKRGYVYLLASRRNGTLYIGVTSDLTRRVWQHRTEAVDGFSARYGTKMLVYFEVYEDIETAIAREKALKKWRRQWKLELIEKNNPDWRDFYPDIVG
jgi:putative endonuclease